uniref:Putative imaginal disc growth factor n=1 Tax=Maconellicoccus hirsutus TaxID=177089 RepID=A2I495_MACHI|nr:putative imaginal disc growth factor [Maconellicoccus hirsutus]
MALKMHLLFLISSLYVISYVNAVGKISCFYDSKAYNRKGIAQVTAEELKPAALLCNYIIYSFVGMDSDKYKIKSLDESLDTEKGKNNFRAVTNLKLLNPQLKVLVSVGGFWDDDEPEKYLKSLEKQEHRAKFIESAVKLAKDYNFDGIDLAWQFPIVKEKKDRGTLGSIWHSIKKAVTSSTKDDKEKEHKEQFTALVRELGAALRGNKQILTLSVLPHVNSKAYFDGNNFKDWIEHIHLMTYDYRTPKRTPEEADFAAPTQFLVGRNESYNIEATVKWWLEQKMPANKLLITIPTFGRTWKLTTDSGKTGVPPVKKADEEGEEGAYLKEKGRMAYYEICPILSTDANPPSTLLKKVTDSTYRTGSYAFRPADSKKKGIWVSYEDPDVAAKKAYYAKLKGLGGVAIMDLSLDDFKGSCDKTGVKFPITTQAKINL